MVAHLWTHISMSCMYNPNVQKIVDLNENNFPFHKTYYLREKEKSRHTAGV
jgi:ribosomal protein L19